MAEAFLGESLKLNFAEWFSPSGFYSESQAAAARARSLLECKGMSSKTSPGKKVLVFPLFRKPLTEMHSGEVGCSGTG